MILILKRMLKMTILNKYIRFERIASRKNRKYIRNKEDLGGIHNK
jgi:hypothetical protein